jgi:hypothetical protein
VKSQYIPQVSATIGGLAGTLWPSLGESSQDYGYLQDYGLPMAPQRGPLSAVGDLVQGIGNYAQQTGEWLANPETWKTAASGMAGMPYQVLGLPMDMAAFLGDLIGRERPEKPMAGTTDWWRALAGRPPEPDDPAFRAGAMANPLWWVSPQRWASGLGKVGENLDATGGFASKGRMAKQSGVLYLDLPTAKNLRPFYNSDTFPLYVAPPGQPIAMSDIKSVVLPEGAQRQGTLTRNARALATPDQAVWLWPENAALHYDVFKDVYGDRASLFKKAMAEGKPLDTAFLGMDDLADFWSASKHGQLYGNTPEAVSDFRTWARLDRQGAARDFGATATGRAGRIPEMLRGGWESIGIPKWERGAVSPFGLKPLRKVPPMKTAAWDNTGRAVFGDEDIRAYGQYDNHPALAKYKLHMNPGSPNYTAGFYLPDEDKLLDRSMTSQYLMDRLGMVPVGTEAGKLGKSESWTTGAFANTWNAIDADTRRALWREAMDFQRDGAVPTDQNIQYIANALGLSSPDFVRMIGGGDLGFGADRLGEVLYGILHP